MESILGLCAKRFCTLLTVGALPPTSPVVTLAGRSGGEGKSFFFNGLSAVYGGEHTFHTPQHPTFPLFGLENAKIAYLDDFRFCESVVPLAVQCLWFGGSPVQVAKPQNAPGVASHDTYGGRAPIFITTSISDIAALHAAGDGDASMLLRRLMVVTFAARVVILAQDLPVCAACFARFVLAYS